MNPIHEQLSALMDGELGADATRFVLKRAGSERELRLDWGRWHVAREVLRRQGGVVFVPAGFADAVMARLEMVQVEPRRGAVHPWLRWGAGGAIAAAVAVAALMVLPPPGAEPAGVAPMATATAPRTPVQGLGAIGATPVAATSAARDFRAPLLPATAPIEAAPASFGGDAGSAIGFDPHMQSYLLRHYQSVGRSGQSPYVPYVLLVTPQPAPAQQPDRQER